MSRTPLQPYGLTSHRVRPDVFIEALCTTSALDVRWRRVERGVAHRLR